MALLRRRRLSAGVAATAAIMVFAGSFAFAQTTPAPIIRDVAQRLPDGLIVAPKQAQRTPAIRTESGSIRRLGQMVTLVAATSAEITGIAMPRDAVIRGTSGE